MRRLLPNGCLYHFHVFIIVIHDEFYSSPELELVAFVLAQLTQLTVNGCDNDSTVLKRSVQVHRQLVMLFQRHTICPLQYLCQCSLQHRLK